MGHPRDSIHPGICFLLRITIIREREIVGVLDRVLELTHSMSVLDYSAFPHIFDAVLEHLVSDRDEVTLRTMYRLSSTARSRVYRKCCHHLRIDYRDFPVSVGTAVGRFWIPQLQPSLAHTVCDIYAAENCSVYPLHSKAQDMIVHAAPRIIRLLEHYGMEDTLSYTGPVDTVVFHTKNWSRNREPGPWFLMLPGNVKRIVVNLIGCPEFGYPDVAFAPAHSHTTVHQELVLIVTEGGPPPPGAEAVTVNHHYLFDNASHSVLAFLEEQAESTVTLVGAEGWKADWTPLALPTDMEGPELGQHLFIRALTNRCRESTSDAATGDWRHNSAAVVDSFLRRIEFVTLKAFEENVGKRIFELFTLEDA